MCGAAGVSSEERAHEADAWLQRRHVLRPAPLGPTLVCLGGVQEKRRQRLLKAGKDAREKARVRKEVERAALDAQVGAKGGSSGQLLLQWQCGGEDSQSDMQMPVCLDPPIPGCSLQLRNL
jgi:hypothetical protein